MTTTATATSKPASQQTNTAPTPIFWPTWVPPALPTAMPVMSALYDSASVADANGNRLTSGATVIYEWKLTTKPGQLLGSGGNLKVYAGEVLGAGAQAADLSLSSGATEIDNLAGAFVQMQGSSNVLAATSVTANALHYGSFQLLGGTETLTINQAASSSPTAPSGVPALVVNAAGEKSTVGTDTINITTATIASTTATTPDVFVHLGTQIASVAVTGSGTAVIVASAGRLSLNDKYNTGGTQLTFGSGEAVAYGGSGHNVTRCSPPPRSPPTLSTTSRVRVGPRQPQLQVIRLRSRAPIQSRQAPRSKRKRLYQRRAAEPKSTSAPARTFGWPA